MPCSQLPQALSRAWPNSVVHQSKMVGRNGSVSAGRAPETYGLTPGASAAGGARDCRRRNTGVAVMQVRPLSVVSGAAGSSPFGCSPFGRLGWL